MRIYAASLFKKRTDAHAIGLRWLDRSLGVIQSSSYNAVAGALGHRWILLVDSDHLTDQVKVRKFINKPGDWVIFTTYDSALNVVDNVLAKKKRTDCLIVADEVHNAANSQPLCSLINTFGRALLLTATVPEALEKGLYFSRQYTLQVPEAIKRGIITEYKVIVR